MKTSEALSIKRKRLIARHPAKVAKTRLLPATDAKSTPALLLIRTGQTILAEGLTLLMKETFPNLQASDSFTDNPAESLNMVAGLPDIIVVSQSGSAPDTALTQIIQVARKRFPLTPVVVIGEETISGKEALQLYRMGISGYLYGGQNISELIRCIDQIEEGKNYVSEGILDLLLLCVSSPDAHRETQSPKALLTPNEFEIARSLSQGRKVKEIADESGRKCSTISTIKRRIYKKLGIENALHLYDLMRDDGL